MAASSSSLVLEAFERMLVFPGLNMQPILHEPAEPGRSSGRFIAVATDDVNEQIPSLLLAHGGSAPSAVDNYASGSKILSSHSLGRTRMATLSAIFEPGHAKQDYILSVAYDMRMTDPIGPDDKEWQKYIVTRSHTTTEGVLEILGEYKLPVDLDHIGSFRTVKLVVLDLAPHVILIYNLEDDSGNLYALYLFRLNFSPEAVAASRVFELLIDDAPIDGFNALDVDAILGVTGDGNHVLVVCNTASGGIAPPYAIDISSRRTALQPSSPSSPPRAPLATTPIARALSRDGVFAGRWALSGGANDGSYTYLVNARGEQLVFYRLTTDIARAAATDFLHTHPAVEPAVARFDVGAFSRAQQPGVRSECSDVAVYWDDHLGALLIAWQAGGNQPRVTRLGWLLVTPTSWSCVVAHGLVPSSVRETLRAVAGLRWLASREQVHDASVVAAGAGAAAAVATEKVWASLPLEVFECFVAAYWDVYQRGRVLP